MPVGSGLGRNTFFTGNAGLAGQDRCYWHGEAALAAGAQDDRDV
jgi:hypothetical protein